MMQMRMTRDRFMDSSSGSALAGSSTYRSGGRASLRVAGETEYRVSRIDSGGGPYEQLTGPQLANNVRKSLIPTKPSLSKSAG